MSPYYLIGKKSLTLEEQEFLVNHKDGDVVYEISRRPDLDPKFHERLVNHPQWTVVINMINNPAIGDSLLIKCTVSECSATRRFAKKQLAERLANEIKI